MNQIFLGQPSDYIKNWFITKFPYWPKYTTLKFKNGSTQTKEINGAATWQNIGVKNDTYQEDNTLTYCQLGKNVTEIAGYAFYECNSLTSVSIPSSVTTLGEILFGRCYSLTSVTIPNSVTSIGNGAFSRCYSLTSINIPDSVASIGIDILSCCYSLTSITVDPNNTKYDSRDNCNAIIETSSNRLTYGCGSTTIPNSVTSIGDSAFFNCSSLTSINIPNSVTSIGSYAFSDCYSLTSINIPSSVTSIGDYVFFYCSSLTSVTIPNSVTKIGYNAFSQCYSLTSVTIQNSVTSIGSGAFSWCSSLTSISIPSSVTSIGNWSFDYCSSLTSVIFEGRTSAEITAMANYPWGIPNTSAFKPGIQGPQEPQEQTYTTLEFVDGTSQTKEITGVATWENIGVKTSGYGSNNTLAYCQLGKNVTEISSNTFSDCYSLTSVSIPNSVTSIGDVVFTACTSLTSISIPNSVISIGDSALSGCYSLFSVNIPRSVTSIGEYAFTYCSSLTSLIFEGRTSAEITAMANYPWGISDTSIISSIDGRLGNNNCCSYSAFNEHETYTL